MSNIKTIENIIYNITNVLRDSLQINQENTILCLYLLLCLRDYKEIKTWNDMQDTDIIPEHIKYALCDRLNSGVFCIIKKYADALSEQEAEMIKNYIVDSNDYSSAPRNGNMCTPASIVNLASRILDVHDGEMVGDFCCGYGNYLAKDIKNHKKAHYCGIEINTVAEAISEIKMELIDASGELVLGDAFSILGFYYDPFCFNKIFSNYPFAIPVKYLDPNNYLKERFQNEIGTSNHYKSSDWLFNYLLTTVLRDDGKAVGIMTNGSTWNSLDIAARRYFVENGLIEAVITLPQKMFYSTSISTSLIVLSHNNEKVRLVDATQLCVKGRRNNEFSESNINEIMEALKEDREYSRAVSREELRKNEYVLNFNRYANMDALQEDGIAFEEIIKRITRGAHLTAEELDNIASIKPTKYQYLMLGNINDGIIEDDLPFITHIDEKNEKYCIHDHTLVVSKNGYPYKIAVAELTGERKVLANGNLYIIELDEEKADPYYIKAYLESEKGILTLNTISVGAILPNIGVEKLKKIVIPLPELSEQKQIADQYRASIDEVRILKKKLKRAVDRMHHLLDEEDK